MGILTELMMKASSWLTLLPRISLRNLFEIAIISFLVYEILFWIKNTRAWTLLKGLLTIMVFAIVAVLLRLDTIVWILKNITTIAVTAFLVVFQPELRKALEQLGSQNLLSGILAQDDGKSSQAVSGIFSNKVAVHDVIHGLDKLGQHNGRCDTKKNFPDVVFIKYHGRRIALFHGSGPPLGIWFVTISVKASCSILRVMYTHVETDLGITQYGIIRYSIGDVNHKLSRIILLENCKYSAHISVRRAVCCPVHWQAGGHEQMPAGMGRQYRHECHGQICSAPR